MPKLVAPADMVTFNKRLSLNDAIKIILRKTQVASTLIKCLNVRREVSLTFKSVFLQSKENCS